ncbi:MAG: 4Fe-4S dicluster domain-containing protein [Bacteroidetes bacterium]|nr:4Fe-4S dicluster domain-containing protein [Bacteroidota bacterium]
MAHITLRSAYSNLLDRINRFPQGAPQSESLYKILKMLFSEREAEFVSLLPIKPFDSKTASRLTKKSLIETEKMLDELSSRGILLDTESNGKTFYTLPPPMAGFFEFSLMRLRTDIDQKVLSELFYQYLNVEEDFVKELFTTGETQLGRTFINEKAIDKTKLEVLDYERASEVINTASYIGIGVCYCRHKMEHIGKACNAPMNICMTFNGVASSLIRHNIARQVDINEGMDILQQAYGHNLVQFGENVQKDVNFICNCCGCCCEAMLAAKRFASLNPIHTTNYLPSINDTECNGCAKCVDVCPVEAMTLVSANNPERSKKKKAKLDEEICLGCGLCIRACNKELIEMHKREHRVITPINSAHRTVMMAIERGQLQNLIFDNHALWNHLTIAAILGVILKLPPLKQTLASQQMKSRYLSHLLANYGKN